jgi:hypothetical protein
MTEQEYKLMREAGAIVLLSDAEASTFSRLTRAAERERCACLVEKLGAEGLGTLAIAASIRAGGDDELES